MRQPLLNLDDTLIVFVSRDFKKGLDLHRLVPHSLIVCGRNSAAIEAARGDGIDIFCLAEEPETEELVHNSGKILDHPASLNAIQTTAQKNGCKKIGILSLKGTSKLEHLCKKRSWQMLNLDFERTVNLENKAKFQGYLENYKGKKLTTLTTALSDETFDRVKEVLPHNEKLVLQFARGFAGQSTQFISSEEIKKIQTENPGKRVKITPFVEGKTLTLNGCIYNGDVYVSRPFYQKTGLPEYNRFKGGSCGVDFNIEKYVSNEIIEKTIEAAKKLGEIFAKQGHRGFFGLDLITDDTHVYPIEINPRLTANIHPFTSQQVHAGLSPFLLLHLCEFLKIDFQPSSKEGYINHKLVGETLVIRNITNGPLFPEAKSSSKHYSYYSLLVKQTQQVEIPFSHDSKINPDESYTERWLTARAKSV